MRKVIVISLMVAILIPAALFAQDKPDGREIMQAAYDRPDGDDNYSMMTMTLINARGKQRVRQLKMWVKDYGKDSKSLMFFESPADVKGSGFLQFTYDDPAKEDDSWLYLPALKRVRRIAGSGKDDNFMGSDFTYNDMGNRSIDEDTHTLLREEIFDNERCWVVISQSKEENYMYSQVISWVRMANNVEKKVEFYDRQGDLLKVLVLSDVEEIEGFWTPLRMEMDNLQEKHQTVLEFSEFKYNTGIQDNIFRQSTLERGRVR
jgi:outer membrane lipoprotein-sorting protein